MSCWFATARRWLRSGCPSRADGSCLRGHRRCRRPTPISPPPVKGVDLLPPVVLGSPSATAERDPVAFFLLSGLRFQHWCRSLTRHPTPSMTRVAVKSPVFTCFCCHVRDTPRLSRRGAPPNSGPAQAALRSRYSVFKDRPIRNNWPCAVVSWRLQVRKSLWLSRTFHPWRCYAPRTRNSIREAWKRVLLLLIGSSCEPECWTRTRTSSWSRTPLISCVVTLSGRRRLAVRPRLDTATAR
jgi:hypothetical protein